MALPLTVFVLVALSSVVSAGLALALLEERMGRNALYGAQAAAAAEAGIAAVIGAWGTLGGEALSPGASVSLPEASLPGPTAYTARLMRLNGRLFLVQAEGTRTDAAGGILARREAGVILRLADSGAAGPRVTVLRDRGWSSSLPPSP